MAELDTVRGIYEAWTAGGPAAIGPFLSEDVELADPPEMPDARTWHGREAALARIEEVATAIGREGIELCEVSAAGDEALVRLSWSSAGESSAVVGELFHLVRLEGERVARLRVFLSEQAALDAVASH